jgi:hypothetical protein
MNKKNRHFHAFERTSGLVVSQNEGEYPSSVFCWNGSTPVTMPSNGSSFFFVYEGNATLVRHTGNGSETESYMLRSGFYGSVPGSAKISGGSGYFVTRIGYDGLFSIGGPIENQGRLRYIDGCSDTLLVGPVKKGDACLNHLHFPQGIHQTRHTHPTIRCGMVVRGSGHCIVPDEDGNDLWIPLVPGQIFVIPADGQHSFATKNEGMDVIAYHPDSDTGPDDDDHPMINRTIVDGTSAAQLNHLRTAEIVV